VSVAVVSPDARNARFVDWLHAYVGTNAIRAIVPSEGTLLGLRPAFEEFPPHLAVCRREDVPYGGLSRRSVFAQRSADGSEGAHLPPSRLVLRLR
jgi:hypothetical protein